MTPLTGHKLSVAACEHVGIDTSKIRVRDVELLLPADDVVMLRFSVTLNVNDLDKIADIARRLET